MANYPMPRRRDRRLRAGRRGYFLALLATLAHLHANVGNEEHTKEAPGDDLKVSAHANISKGETERCFYRLIEHLTGEWEDRNIDKLPWGR